MRPGAGGDLEVVEAAPWAAVGGEGGGVAVQFGFEQPDRCFGQGVVEGVADGADRGCCADLGEAVGVGDRGVLAAGVGMAHQAAKVDAVAGPRRHVQGVEDQAGVHGAGRFPADDAPREHVDDEGDVDDPRPRRAVREVGYPGAIRSGGGEVTLDEVRGAHRRRVGAGGEPFASPTGAANAGDAHQPGDLVAAHLEAGLAGRLGQLAAPVDGIVLDEQRHQQRDQHGVSDRPRRRRAGLG